MSRCKPILRADFLKLSAGPGQNFKGLDYQRAGLKISHRSMGDSLAKPVVKDLALECSCSVEGFVR